MSHECPECGQTCYCDMEDHDQPTPDDCTHECPPEDDEEYNCECYYVDADVVESRYCPAHNPRLRTER